MTSQAAAPQGSSAEERAKQLRLRKVYIQLRIPRIKAEIVAVAARKKTMSKGSGGEPSKETIEELIYCNQQLVALRSELGALQEERKGVLDGLKELKLQKEPEPLPHDKG